MPLALPPEPPALHAPAVQPAPPLSFIGYTPGMPVATVQRLVVNSGGKFSCKVTSDPRMRECTGILPFAGVEPHFTVLVSSVKDSAAVIVFSIRNQHEIAMNWVPGLVDQFGRPNNEVKPGQQSWEWIRRGTMMRVMERKVKDSLDTSVTLTHGPLLDGLGPPAKKKPD